MTEAEALSENHGFDDLFDDEVKCRRCGRGGFRWGYDGAGHSRLYDKRGSLHICKQPEHTIPTEGVVCRYCGRNNLRWRLIKGNWRTVTIDGELHRCSTHTKGAARGGATMTEQFYKVCPTCGGTGWHAKQTGDLYPDTVQVHCEQCLDTGCAEAYSTGYVEAHPAANEWHTDVENAPRDGTVVLACNKHGHIQTLPSNVMHDVREADPGYVITYATLNLPEDWKSED